jgi:hypothetical protein
MKGVVNVLLMMGFILAGAWGCDETPRSTPGPSARLPENLVLRERPEGARNVNDIRLSAAADQRVVVQGVIAGRKEPLSPDRAILVLLDESIRLCSQIPGDECPTPWDACCEPSEVLAGASVSVEVADGTGAVVRAPLDTIPGIKPGAKLIVSGTVRTLAESVVMVRADGIYVEPEATGPKSP